MSSALSVGFPLNFYPRPPRGGRQVWSAGPAPFRLFLSTPSARRATGAGRGQGPACVDFYPRPPRGGRLRICFVDNFDHVISIHALREEGDAVQSWKAASAKYFYPRPPRGGRLVLPGGRRGCRAISIHALREEGDPSDGRCQPAPGYFYPRPPRGGRQSVVVDWYYKREFLSTPSARRATCRINNPRCSKRFLSTPSARRATSARVMGAPL